MGWGAVQAWGEPLHIPPHRSPVHRHGPPGPPGTYGPECTRMEPTLSTPASFRLGQAPLSSWQRPWKFSCSKMAIWKRGGGLRAGHAGPAAARWGHTLAPATSSAQPHIYCSPDLVLPPKTRAPAAFNKPGSVNQGPHPSEQAVLAPGCPGAGGRPRSHQPSAGRAARAPASRPPVGHSKGGTHAPTGGAPGLSAASSAQISWVSGAVGGRSAASAGMARD